MFKEQNTNALVSESQNALGPILDIFSKRTVYHCFDVKTMLYSGMLSCHKNGIRDCNFGFQDKQQFNQRMEHNEWSNKLYIEIFVTYNFSFWFEDYENVLTSH